MILLFDNLRDITVTSIALRLTLAVLCGGIVGLEREYKRRSAGFRTHILICLGAAMAAMTSQHLFLNMHYYLDIARIGGSVVSGIGFMGAGTIIVTRRQRVKGLTTAAGLWASAIVGVSLGAGFYEGGIFATLLILAAELLFSRLEYRILENAPEINLYLEYAGKDCLEELLQLYREWGLKILNMGVLRPDRSEHCNACAIFSLRLKRGCGPDELLRRVRDTEGVISVREL